MWEIRGGTWTGHLSNFRCDHKPPVSSPRLASGLNSNEVVALGIMSFDLDWDNLTSELANSLVEILNRRLGSATRPSFIGPVQILSFDFGNVPPEVEVIDIRNIHPDFLEDDE